MPTRQSGTLRTSWVLAMLCLCSYYFFLLRGHYTMQSGLNILLMLYCRWRTLW